MMFPKITKFSSALAAGIMFMVSAVAPAFAQVAPTVLATKTSSDGSLTLTLLSSNAAGAVDVNNTYTWTVTNNSSATVNGVILGSHWGDYCINFNGGCPWAPPQGPTLISVGPGCAGQSTSNFDQNIAVFGVWCTDPNTGVSLAPGASVSGSVTLRPNTGGPVDYTVYTGHNASTGLVFDVMLTYSGINAPAATDMQISGAASTGSPAVGSAFTYTYQIKNAGPWGTFGGIIFADTLPDSLTYVSSTVVQATLTNSTLATQPVVEETFTNLCSVVGQTVVCKLNDMTIGGQWNQATVTLTVLAPSTAQPISNTATVHTVSPQDDSNLANNSVTVSVAAK